MPTRWVINPIIKETAIYGTVYRYPKVSRIADPGRTPKTGTDPGTGKAFTVQPVYRHCTVYPPEDSAIKWCLSCVAGEDFTPVDNDPEIITVLDNADDLSVSFSTLPQAVRDKIKAALKNRGVTLARLKDTDDLRSHVRALGRRLDAGFNPPLTSGAFGEAFHRRGLPK